MSAQVSKAEIGQAKPVTQAANDAVAAPQAAAPEARKRRPGRLVLMVAVPLLIAGAGGYFYLTGGRFEETDNAYVQQAKVAVSSDIAGRIVAVNISENQMVHAGDVLFSIDAAPYEIALNQANAALGSARVNVEQLKVSYRTAQTALKAATGTLAIQQASYDRQDSLVAQGVSSASALDQPKLSLQTAQNAVASAEQQVASATAALAGNPDIATDEHPAVLAALSQVELAERNLGKTEVVAAADGVISQIASLNVGQFLPMGTTIASLVETKGTWVEANFKETQLAAIHIGMRAEVAVDASPGAPLEGTVTSIGAATGSEFSLIPAQNATGNWVKVVQRIPVRVDFDAPSDVQLRSGMSALVSVDTGKSTLDKLQSH
ncbi:membrane fusion protein, multidrug efflux system [Devosia sp. YR412]|uniref:HlyD family secretion protein n=1 Tax=Devosia sp. YR412 TaxID=1881030 RepID=UPI0008CF4105|nr:HlyD family secretion protein [Devosia sp. YR412]SEQ52793.1 membrane fusion protein, multidrug efflux system [Devosia sp. YR412]